jgi:hypothetical protein
MARVKFFDGQGRAIANVKSSDILARWNGHRWVHGGPGQTKALTKTEDGYYVAIRRLKGLWQVADVILNEDAADALDAATEGR